MFPCMSKYVCCGTWCIYGQCLYVTIHLCVYALLYGLRTSGYGFVYIRGSRTRERERENLFSGFVVLQGRSRTTRFNLVRRFFLNVSQPNLCERRLSSRPAPPSDVQHLLDLFSFRLEGVPEARGKGVGRSGNLGFPERVTPTHSAPPSFPHPSDDCLPFHNPFSSEDTKPLMSCRSGTEVLVSSG